MAKIPADAKCVFKGVIFEVWQWQQEMFDGTTETFEMLKRPDTTVVIPLVGDKIILLDEEQPAKPPFISFPGGRIEEGEKPLDAAKRELLEETGCTSDDWELWYQTNPVSKMDWTVFVYIARGCQNKQEPELEAGEKITTRLIDFDEFISLADNPDFRGGDTTTRLLMAKYDPEEREKLQKLLFKK